MNNAALALDRPLLRTRSYQYAPPGQLPRDLAELSGLALMQRLIAGALPPPSIASTLDFALVEVAEGFAAFEGTPAEWMYNPLGTVHGGWMATLLDSALGCAVHTTLAPGRGYTTASLEIKFIRPVSAATGRVRAEGRVVHAGNRTATADAKLLGPDGKLLAHATTTCVIL